MLRGSLALAGNPSDIDVVDQRAYIPAYNGGLKIVDVTNPISPTLLGNSTESLGSVTGVKAVGNRVYIAGLSGLFIFDVSNPLSPHLLGSFDSVGHGGGNSYNLDVIDTLVYLADGGGGLQIIDVSNPASPTLRGSIDLPIYSLEVRVSDGLAYIAGREGGLAIVDVTNPAAPILRGSFDTAGAAYDIQVLNGLAYVSDYTGGLLILDVENPASPIAHGSYMTAGNTAKSWVEGNLAYVAAGSDGLRVIDVGTPGRPRVLGSLALPGWIASVHVVDDLAYLCDRVHDTFFIVDVSDPADPSLIGSYVVGQGVRVVDGLIYVTGYLAGLQILSSSPELLSKATTITPNGGQAASVDGSVQLQFSAGAVQEPITVLYLSQLRTADAFDGAGVAVRRFMAEGRARGGLAVAQTNQPYTMSVDYTDAQLAQLGISEANLNLAYWADGAWVNALPCAGCGIDLASNRVTVHMARLTQFALVGGAGPTPPPPPGPTVSPAGSHIDSFDGNVSLDFPAGAVTSTVTITYTSLITPAQPLSHDQIMIHSFWLEARAGSGQPVTRFAQPFTMVISYTDAQLAALSVSETNLNLAYWDGSAWVNALPCVDCGVDIDHNRVTVVLDRFGEFALVANREHSVFVPLISR